MSDTEIRECPEAAALMIQGTHYPCDAMRHMHPSSDTHDGWPHSSSKAEAIWLPARGLETPSPWVDARIPEEMTE